jgi:hypothetical protein
VVWNLSVILTIAILLLFKNGYKADIFTLK